MNLTNEKRCTKCGKIKPLSEFYMKDKDGGYYSCCKACKLAYQKERHKQVMNDPDLHHKRLVSQAKYRERYRSLIAKNERLKRRKMGIPPQCHINKKMLLDLYKQGLPIEVIAEKCNCSKSTVKLYAYRNGIKRGHNKQRICYLCSKYPCFMGQENIESNFAVKCKNFK